MTQNRRFRKAGLAAAALTCTAVTASLLVQMPTRLIWNVSASVPTGLYAVSPPHSLRRGDLVAVAPPEPLATSLIERGYIGRGAPLLKRIEALPGAKVCRDGTRVTVDGALRAIAREHDRFGRPLPRWSGCRIVSDDELFLLNAEQPASLDGRYFGPLPRQSVVGRASPLWTREAR